MLFRRKALALVAALIALSSTSVLAAQHGLPADLAAVIDSAASNNEQPDAVPDRSAALMARRKVLQASVAYGDEDADILTSIMDELPMMGGSYGYGYYGYYNDGGYYGAGSPTQPPGDAPPPSETGSPSPSDTPEPTESPVQEGEVPLRFLATFPATAQSIAQIRGNEQAFKTNLASTIANQFASLGVTPSSIRGMSIEYSGARRRRDLLQGQSVAVDYLVVFPKGTSEATLAQVKEQTKNNAGAVFSPSFLGNYGLQVPTVQEMTPATPAPSSSPGGSSNTPPGANAPPSPPPPSGSAARTPVSVAMIALSFFGSSMLLALLW